MHLERCSTLIGIIGIHRPKIITHRIKLIVDVLAPPAPHVPPVVDEAADVEVRGVNEPVQCQENELADLGCMQQIGVDSPDEQREGDRVDDDEGDGGGRV